MSKPWKDIYNKLPDEQRQRIQTRVQELEEQMMDDLNYLDTFKLLVPRVIKTNEDLEEVQKVIDLLLDKKTLTKAEDMYLDLLSELVYSYESKLDLIPDITEKELSSSIHQELQLQLLKNSTYGLGVKQRDEEEYMLSVIKSIYNTLNVNSISPSIMKTMDTMYSSLSDEKKKKVDPRYLIHKNITEYIDRRGFEIHNPVDSKLDLNWLIYMMEQLDTTLKITMFYEYGEINLIDDNN
jgi:hypothetical protein